MVIEQLLFKARDRVERRKLNVITISRFDGESNVDAINKSSLMLQTKRSTILWFNLKSNIFKAGRGDLWNWNQSTNAKSLSNEIIDVPLDPHDETRSKAVLHNQQTSGKH